LIAAHAVLDVLTTVLYGAFALRQTAKLTTRELAEGRVAEADLRSAPAAYAEAHMIVTAGSAREAPRVSVGCSARDRVGRRSATHAAWWHYTSTSARS